jgi:hypothetical protein
VRLLKAFGSVYRSILDATAMTMMAMSTIAVLTSDVDTRARITQHNPNCVELRPLFGQIAQTGTYTRTKIEKVSNDGFPL